MTTLQFADTHNMVMFLSKPAESEGFEQIANVKVKTVNGKVQLQALVDGKKIIVTKAYVGSDLQLDDEEGTDCLPNATIFEELTRIGYENLSQKLTFYKAFFSPQWKFFIHTILQCLSAKTTAWNEFISTMASAIICLAANQKFNFSKYIFKSMVKNMENVSGKFLMYPRFVQVFLDKQLEGISRRPKRKDTEIPQSSGPTNNVADEALNEKMDDSSVRAATTGLDAEQDSGGGSRRQETIRDTIAQTGFENISKTSNDPMLARGNTLRSGKDRLKLEELMEFCTKLQQRFLDLENTKTAQAQEITSLKRRVKRLENKNRSKTYGLKRLYKVGLSARIESSKDEGLGEEDASKQGRIDDIDANEDIYLVNVHIDEDMFRVNDLEHDEVVVETEVAYKDVNISVDEVTLAQALAALKITAPSTRPKAKGLIIHEEEQATTPIVSSQQPSHVKVQGKGKGIIVEEPLKMKKKDQISFDEQEAIRLQAEFDEEERLAREEEEANIVSWDNVQAMIDADYQMAQQRSTLQQ
ncbi:hypothetical protein Tco_0238341 [Tanacetum coccineum]